MVALSISLQYMCMTLSLFYILQLKSQLTALHKDRECLHRELKEVDTQTDIIT